MDDRQERATAAASVPLQSGAGMGASMGVAAPIGAVSRKDRARAARTALQRDGTAGLVLRTALPGTVALQRLGADRTWETVERRAASRLGRTRLRVPAGSTSSSVLRVVFSPRNANLPACVSEEVDA